MDLPIPSNQPHSSNKVIMPWQIAKVEAAIRGGFHLDCTKCRPPYCNEVVAGVLERRCSLHIKLEQSDLNEQLSNSPSFQVLAQGIHKPSSKTVLLTTSELW